MLTDWEAIASHRRARRVVEFRLPDGEVLWIELNPLRRPLRGGGAADSECRRDCRRSRKNEESLRNY
jgi:hypothetical protein